MKFFEWDTLRLANVRSGVVGLVVLYLFFIEAQVGLAVMIWLLYSILCRLEVVKK